MSQSKSRSPNMSVLARRISCCKNWRSKEFNSHRSLRRDDCHLSTIALADDNFKLSFGKSWGKDVSETNFLSMAFMKRREILGERKVCVCSHSAVLCKVFTEYSWCAITFHENDLCKEWRLIVHYLQEHQLWEWCVQKEGRVMLKSCRTGQYVWTDRWAVLRIVRRLCWDSWLQQNIVIVLHCFVLTFRNVYVCMRTCVCASSVYMHLLPDSLTEFFGCVGFLFGWCKLIGMRCIIEFEEIQGGMQSERCTWVVHVRACVLANQSHLHDCMSLNCCGPDCSEIRRYEPYTVSMVATSTSLQPEEFVPFLLAGL